MPQVIKSSSRSCRRPRRRATTSPCCTISFVLNNALFMGILFCVVLYFFFAFEQRNRAVQGTAQAGAVCADVGVRRDLRLDHHDAHGAAD